MHFNGFYIELSECMHKIMEHFDDTSKLLVKNCMTLLPVPINCIQSRFVKMNIYLLLLLLLLEQRTRALLTFIRIMMINFNNAFFYPLKEWRNTIKLSDCNHFTNNCGKPFC